MCAVPHTKEKRQRRDLWLGLSRYDSRFVDLNSF
jgi:hypothetical protein